MKLMQHVEVAKKIRKIDNLLREVQDLLGIHFNDPKPSNIIVDILNEDLHELKNYLDKDYDYIVTREEEAVLGPIYFMEPKKEKTINFLNPYTLDWSMLHEEDRETVMASNVIEVAVPMDHCWKIHSRAPHDGVVMDPDVPYRGVPFPSEGVKDK